MAMGCGIIYEVGQTDKSEFERIVDGGIIDD